MKIEGFFANIKTAKDTIEKLKAAGFNSAFVDINEHYVDNRNVKTNLPGTSASPSLSGLVLESGDHAVDRSKSPLTAASPMVSGMGNFEEIADVNCKIVVDADKKGTDSVRRLITEMGGSLDSPNVKKPRVEEDVDIVSYNALDEMDRDV